MDVKKVVKCINKTMERSNKDKLNALMMERLKQKYPNMPEAYIPKTDWTDNSANALTKCVIAWIQFNGGQAERISSQGQYREGAKIQVGSGIMAHTKQLPGKWTPGQSTKGTADISATIRGRSVKIEIKQKDKQSEAQKQYQQAIENAGGVYIIVRDFDSFMVWYDKFIQSL
jgi:hypothetical protein